MLEKGLIQVYTTKSDHINFAPIGLGLRAAGHNFRTLISCFTSHELMKGCRSGAVLLKPNLVIHHAVMQQQGPGETFMEDRAYEAFQETRRAVLSGEFDIVVLNGVHQLINRAIVTLEDLLALSERKPPNVEIVFSGSMLPRELIETAHLVTEMVVKHHPAKVRIEKTSEDRGTIEVVTGKGKGKTTYCLGKAMLSACTAVSSFVLQVIKSPKQYGEVMAIERLPNLKIRTMGKGFVSRDGEAFEEKHVQAARRAWEVWLREIYSSKYELLVLDEINVATHFGLIHHDRVEEMLFLRPPNIHLLLSGRNAHPNVIKAATTLIEMREIKHPFHEGICARKGIEF